MSICTIDVHSRDTVSKMILQKIESVSSFSWQSQLRHRCHLSQSPGSHRYTGGITT